MTNFFKTIWRAKFPIHNKYTVALGYVFLVIALILIIRYYIL